MPVTCDACGATFATYAIMRSCHSKCPWKDASLRRLRDENAARGAAGAAALSDSATVLEEMQRLAHATALVASSRCPQHAHLLARQEAPDVAGDRVRQVVCDDAARQCQGHCAAAARRARAARARDDRRVRGDARQGGERRQRRDPAGVAAGMETDHKEEKKRHKEMPYIQPVTRDIDPHSQHPEGDAAHRPPAPEEVQVARTVADMPIPEVIRRLSSTAPSCGRTSRPRSSGCATGAAPGHRAARPRH